MLLSKELHVRNIQKMLRPNTNSQPFVLLLSIIVFKRII